MLICQTPGGTTWVHIVKSNHTFAINLLTLVHTTLLPRSAVFTAQTGENFS